MNPQQERLYRRWEWRTIICLMIGYALFYFVRKNFSMAIPAMEAQLGLSKVQLGIFLTLNGIIYGASRFVIGILGYLSTMVSGIWFGHIADSALGWDRVYILTIAFGIIGSLIIALLWKVPADGYEKVNKIIAEHPEL